MKNVYTYRVNQYEYATIDAAKAAAPVRVVDWVPKVYDQCEYHGDSLEGVDKQGNAIYEIKFLMNHNFCCARTEGKTCGYDQ